MRVMCINDNWNPPPGFTGPAFLQKCTVVRVRRAFDTDYYSLAEFRNGLNYLSEHFAILPDASADQMNEETREAIVNLESVPV